MNLCSHCGADYTPGVNAACRDCGLAPDLETPPTLPAPSDDVRATQAGEGEGAADEVIFDVAEWPAAQRAGFAGALHAEDVPFRWEAGPVLVVRTFDEAVVEGLLEDEGIDDEEWQETTGIAEEEEADEAAQTAMSELFDAADRLVRSPGSGEVVDEVSELAGIIGASPPPYGIEKQAWDEMASQAEAVVAAGAEADDGAVEDAARRLRDFLRTYV